MHNQGRVQDWYPSHLLESERVSAGSSTDSYNLEQTELGYRSHLKLALDITSR